MVESSTDLKKSANAQFVAADYSSAISTYDKALSELPSYLDYELAVLQSNIAACHVKLEQWKEAIDACENGLAGLERELPTKKKTKTKSKSKSKSKNSKDDSTSDPKRNGISSDTESDSDHEQVKSSPQNDAVVEHPSDASDTELTAQIAALNLSDARKGDITRIRTKLLLRRARSRSSITPSSWTHLGGALEDYRTLSTPEYFSTLPPSDQRTVRQALTTLPARVNEAKDKEVGEMMGKLKELGNGILKPFGLSTDMFKMTQDQGTGGWSMNFDQGGGGRPAGGDGEKKEG